MRTNAKIRKRIGVYAGRAFKPCTELYYGDALYLRSSIASMECDLAVREKAEAMHKIIAAAPVNSNFSCIIKVDKEVDDVPANG